MKNLTTKLSLFAFLSSLSLAIIPAELALAQCSSIDRQDWIDKLQSYHIALADLEAHLKTEHLTLINILPCN